MLLVAARGQYASALSFHLKPLGFTIEHHADPLHVIEHLDQIDPQAILVHAGDFPRHWKPIVKLARDWRAREELICLLAVPLDFPPEDAAKAAYLGVNGILGDDLSDKKELYRLEEIVRRYRSVSEKRAFTRLMPQTPDELGFAFTHPLRMAFVTGKIREISIQGSSFLPALPSAVSDLTTGTEIPNCSLRVEDKIVTVTCRVTRNREELGFQFLSFGEGGHDALLKYIQARGQRAIKAAASAPAAR
jgi:hypothetical protein